MPKDIGSLYAQALKGSLRNLPNQVKEGLLKQNFDRALQGSSNTLPLMETIPTPTIIKSVITTSADPIDTPVETSVPIAEPVDVPVEAPIPASEPIVTPLPLKTATIKPIVRSAQSGSTV